MPGKAGVTQTRGTNRIGERFDRLVVIARTNKRDSHNGGIIWLCRCDCGNEKEVSARYLSGGNTRSCGCIAQECREAIGKTHRLDLKGRQFGRLTVLHLLSDDNTKGKVIWVCRCVCGNEVNIQANYLNAGRNSSCGCLIHDIARCEETEKLSRSRSPRSRTISQRTPKWSDRKAIDEIYKNRPAGHDVDHIIPLRGKLVSGLHVPENLQYLPRRQNLSKRETFVVA